MGARHPVIAAVVAMSLCGAGSCANRAETDKLVAVSGLRVQVGHETQGFQGATKPYQVPLDDSLASLRRIPPGTPRFGESAYVTELPTPVEQPSPVYPEAARAHGVSGKVLVHTLVLKDGTVGETWIIQSIPELDEAAARSVQRWRFKPALDVDKTVAVWIAVPVEFPAEPH